MLTIVPSPSSGLKHLNETPLSFPMPEDPVPSTNQPIMELRNVERHYMTGEEVVRAIDGIDLTIKTGEFTVITGASGSGKSTLLNLMGLLDSPTSGEVIIHGKAGSTLSHKGKSRIRLREIGFIFQFFNLQNNLNALENVMIPYWMADHPRRESEERARELLERVGLGNRIGHLPSELSGGQQQRVAIARALVNSPAVVLADEPTGNLDSHTTEEVIKLFRRLNLEGQTIVMVTHERPLTEKTGRTIELLDGRIRDDHSR